MPPHSHRGGFNMEPCCSCGEKRKCHTETEAETHCKPKKQSHPQAAMWCAINSHTHIKKANDFTL
ncbi:MAG: hypothetical protein M1540_04455 [Candidatus Bathyarchaeota archaeon]|nr:hypothetical protein [Candidatus Bathyarchaeota archaeon]